MRSYPYTIQNGGGELLTFERRIPTPAGDRLEGGNVVAPGAGPPMHVHHFQEEALTVMRGRLGYQRVGESPAFAGPGETIVFRAGEGHRFWNAGEEELECSAYIEPAGNVEYFLEGIFDSTRAHGGVRPGIFDAAYLTRRYRTEFEMLAIPRIVQRLLFPVIVAVGKRLGKYEKYADAPLPLAVSEG